MSPFGLETLPADALRALRTLPVLAERLAEVASHTALLGSVRTDVERIAESVAPVPEIGAGVGAVVAHTDALPTMDRRIAAIETSIHELSTTLERLAASIETLDENLAALQGSMAPVGRLADKLPGSSPPS